jgi:hypothetical protein
MDSPREVQQIRSAQDSLLTPIVGIEQQWMCMGM